MLGCRGVVHLLGEAGWGPSRQHKMGQRTAEQVGYPGGQLLQKLQGTRGSGDGRVKVWQVRVKVTGTPRRRNYDVISSLILCGSFSGCSEKDRPGPRVRRMSGHVCACLHAQSPSCDLHDGNAVPRRSRSSWRWRGLGAIHIRVE